MKFTDNLKNNEYVKWKEKEASTDNHYKLSYLSILNKFCWYSKFLKFSDNLKNIKYIKSEKEKKQTLKIFLSYHNFVYE